MTVKPPSVPDPKGGAGSGLPGAAPGVPKPAAAPLDLGFADDLATPPDGP
ncbi:hypothetical protein G3I35_01635, partial [Streptomyces sp. SID10815]|nr:hypothetical protein [Streptomyces sp. SID10815]